MNVSRWLRHETYIAVLACVGFVTRVFPLVDIKVVPLIKCAVAKLAYKRLLASVYQLVTLAMPGGLEHFLAKIAPVAFGSDRRWLVQC